MPSTKHFQDQENRMYTALVMAYINNVINEVFFLSVVSNFEMKNVASIIY